MYASVEGVAARLSDEEVIFQTRNSGASQVMTMQVLEVMGETRPFRSMDEHIAQVMRSVRGLRDSARARQGLESLARNGLLCSDAEFFADLHAAQETAPAPLAGLCIRACDRPVQVKRLLDSLVEYERRFGTQRRVLLFDDSRDTDAQRSNAAYLREYAKATGAPVQVIGPDESQRLLKQLRKAVPAAADAAAELLEQRADTAGGRNWNLALLLTAGRRLVMLDEDFVFPLRRHPEARDGLDPSAADRATARFYDNLDDALAAGTDIAEDPFELHLACSGRNLGALLSQPALALDRGDVRGMPLEDLRHLRADARVVTTLNGTRGASGTNGSSWLYLLDQSAREQFWRDRDAYLYNLDAQSIWFGHTRARAARQGYFTPFSIDNSLLTPCTTPRGRNEDALFNTLLNFCHPGSVALHLPLSIGHVQERARKRSDQMQRSGTPQFTEFLYETLQNRLGGVQSTDPEQRMHLAAELLEDLAGAREVELAAHLREYLNYFRADLIERLQRQLVDNPKAPIYWQADLRELIGRLARSMVAKTPPRLDNWPEGIDASACVEHLRADLHATARVLRSWPALWSYARDCGEDLLKAL
jgi:hypothetical protein